MNKRVILLVSVLMMSLNCKSEVIISGGNKYDLKFGLLQHENGRSVVYKETSQIPFVSKQDDPNYRFGYTIDSLDKKSFSYSNKLYAPKIRAITSKLNLDVNVDSNDHVIVDFKPQFVDCEKYNQCYGAALYWLDETDPTGTYKLEIYVNGAFLKTVKFEVIQK